AKVVIDTERVRTDIPVAKVAGEAARRRKLHLVAGGERINIGLQAVQIQNRIGRKLPCEYRGEDWLTSRGISRRNGLSDDGVAERNGNAGFRIDGRWVDKWESAGDEVVLPEIGKLRRDGAASVQHSV